MNLSASANISSPAKINLFLEVFPKEDKKKAFHQLSTLFLAVDFCDQLKFRVKELSKTKKEEKQEDQINLLLSPGSRFSVPTGSENLIYQAIVAYLSFLRQKEPQFLLRAFEFDVYLDKQIPVAAGLAGGSINAASTLKILNQFFGKALSEQELEKLASSLGSDVCFGLNLGLALGLNRGEKIETIDSQKTFFSKIKNYFFLLFIPPEREQLSAKEVYQHFANSPRSFRKSLKKDQISASASVLKKNFLELKSFADLTKLLFNSLEDSVLELSAWSRESKRQIEKLGVQALVSGSGPSLFSCFENYQQALAFQKKTSDLKLESKICQIVY